MNVSRLLHLELSLRTAPRRFGSASSTKQKRQLRNKPLLKRRFTNSFLRLPHPQWTLLSSNSEDQTVVDQEETNEVVEEEESKEEESSKEEKYQGPGAELVNSMIETVEDGRLTTESVETWISSIKDEFMKLEDQINRVTQAAEAEDTELEESKAKYLRLSADFENFRKRADSEKDQLRQNTKGDVLGTLLPLIDNFELAKDQTNPKTEGEEAIIGSFMGLYRQMTDLFTELGVEAIDCDQKPFDPEFHDAILREPNEDLPDGTVMQELRKGFTIGGKLLRPAMVKVSYSEVLQDTELPMEEEEDEGVESTLDLEEQEEHQEEEEAEES